MASAEQLVLNFCDPELRENALLELSKKRELFRDLAPLLWNSYGTIAALLQEIVSIYPALSPPTLTPGASNRVCNALALLQVEIPRAFVCAESKIFDVSEWAICQGMACRANTHCPSFHVNMVGLEKTAAHRSNPLRYPWGLDAQMMPDDDEFDLRLRQALASSLFSDGPKRRKSWSPFKIHQRGMNPWRRSP